MAPQYSAFLANTKPKVNGFEPGSEEFIAFGSLSRSFYPDKSLTTDIEIHAAFLEHCVKHQPTVAAAVLDSFIKKFEVCQSTNNIHAVVSKHKLDAYGMQLVLRAFYSLWNSHPSYYHQNLSIQSKDKDIPGLFSLPDTDVVTSFGGYYNDSNSPQDLAKWLYNVYCPMLYDYVASMSKFMNDAVIEATMQQSYPHGLDVLEWFCNQDSAPSHKYLDQNEACILLFGLAQLMRFMVLYKTLRISPGRLVERFKAVVGHSHGIVIATALSTVSDESSFYAASKKMLGLLMLAGTMPQSASAAINSLARPIVADIAARSVVCVHDLSTDALRKSATAFNNSQTTDSACIHIASNNTSHACAVATTWSTAVCFLSFLQLEQLKERGGEPDAPQSSGISSPDNLVNESTVAEPRSSDILVDELELAVRTAEENGWNFDSEEMRVSVLTMDSGCDIRSESNLTKYLLKSMRATKTDFIQATSIPSISSAKYIVVFGSDKVARFESLVYSLVEGTGAFVVCPNIITQEATAYSHIGTMVDIYKQDVSETMASFSWGVDFSPRLVCTSFDEKLHIDTHMHRIVGKPPVSVVGKHSAALQEQEIADLYNSGYYVEVDISSLNDDTKIKNKLRTLTSLLKPGQGITLGCSYNNPKLWEAQLSAILDLCKEGVPIAGISIVNNAPPPSAFASTTALLCTVGIRYVAFKPQDMEAICQVVEFAQANGSFPVLLQWTRCNGSTPFSFEGFVRPLLETYGAIRSCVNIALAVEFSKQTIFNNPLSYVTGEWSISFGCPSMPIDGILLDLETYSQNFYPLNNVESSRKNRNTGASMAKALDSLYRSLATSILASVYSSDISSVPMEEYIGDKPCAIPVPDNIQAKYLPTKHIFELSDDESKLPDHEIWLQILSSGRKDWLRQLLMSPVVVQGTACVPNPMRLVMRPQSGQIVTLHIVDNAVTRVQINSKRDNSLCASIDHCSSSGDIVVTVYVLMKHVSKSIQFEYSYNPEHAFAPIQQHMDRLYNAMEDFYENVVCNVVGHLDHSETAACFTRCYDSSEPAVSNQWVRDFCQNVNSCIDFYGNCSDSNLRLPIEFVYFLSFSGSIRLLAAPAIGNYHLAYVPLYHRMELIGKIGSFCSNSKMDLRHSVDQLFNTPTGEQVTFSSVVSCNGKQVARTSSSFLAIGGFADTATTFNKIPGQTIIARFPTMKVVQALESKDWFSYSNLAIPPIEPGTLLEFCLDSVYRFKDTGVYSSINTTGLVMLLDPNGRRTQVADICLQKDMNSTTDPVVEFLEQYAVKDGSSLFAHDGYAMELPESTASNPHITVLDSMREFIPICTDNNPVHSNSYFAGLYGIPGTVVHGIWVASAVRAVVDKHVLKGKADRVRTYTAKVTGLAFPKEKLSVSISYIGMANGLIQARGSSAKLDGTRVLNYDLEIEQPKTAYIFTGHQETPAVKTGMDLYEHSDAAKRVWDSANCFMLKVYGVPLLDIVRNNPNSVEVDFKGNNGRRILDTYISLNKECLSASTRVLPGLFNDYQSYTFSSSDGVLRLLQFSQLVHAVDAMANVADMRSKGLIPENALFSGHSLGEISALASLGNGLLSVAEAVDIVFCRGLLLQSLIDDKSFNGLNGANTLEINASLDSVLHTSKMSPHVESIRNKLQTHISALHIDLSALVDCYIPNLIGKPFELSKDYIESAYNATQSPALKHRIDSWQDIEFVDISEQKQIAVELIVELLAFQIAKPVHWTSTQHHISSDQNVCRQITISSCVPTHDIASEPYDGKECDYSKISSLHISRDKELVYYSRGDAF